MACAVLVWCALGILLLGRYDTWWTRRRDEIGDEVTDEKKPKKAKDIGRDPGHGGWFVPPLWLRKIIKKARP